MLIHEKQRDKPARNKRKSQFCFTVYREVQYKELMNKRNRKGEKARQREGFSPLLLNGPFLVCKNTASQKKKPTVLELCNHKTPAHVEPLSSSTTAWMQCLCLRPIQGHGAAATHCRSQDLSPERSGTPSPQPALSQPAALPCSPFQK